MWVGGFVGVSGCVGGCAFGTHVCQSCSSSSSRPQTDGSVCMVCDSMLYVTGV